MKKLLLFLVLVVPATGCFGGRLERMRAAARKAKEAAAAAARITGVEDVAKGYKEEAKASAAEKAESARLNAIFNVKKDLRVLHDGWQVKLAAWTTVNIKLAKITKEFTKYEKKAPARLKTFRRNWRTKLLAWDSQWAISIDPANSRRSVKYLTAVAEMRDVLEEVQPVIDRARKFSMSAVVQKALSKAKTEFEAAQAAAEAEEEAAQTSDEEGAEEEAAEDEEGAEEEGEEETEE
ncbi:hypothetical protein KAT92_01775 [Candidatus Babeliales bacterium]|nr:hypothetical protein [Candidatus Babeliales bacterium]